MDNLEAQREPLRGGGGGCAAGDLSAYKAPNCNAGEWRKTKTLEGPKRAIRLCLLGLILPGLLISVPLYLKHRVFDYQVYPIGMSDMRLIDNRVSTTWCQRQLVKSNATFNAFLMSGAPTVAVERTSVSMTRDLLLSDDMKEYWGFYLLKGSTVTVSTCARWPGASLILIRGHRHLHECAYIGDDSSEELQELMEIVAEGGTIAIPHNVSEQENNSSPTNRVNLLTKHRPEVSFHDPRFDPKLKLNPAQYVFKKRDSETEEELANTKQMRDLLSVLAYKANRAQKSRDNIPEPERQERFRQLKAELLRLQQNAGGHPHVRRVPAFGADGSEHIRFEESLEEFNATMRKMSSKELMEGVLRKLKVLGSKGERVLDMLQKVDKSKLNAGGAAVEEPATTLTGPAAISSTASSSSSSSQEALTDIPIATDERAEKLLRQKRDLILKTLLTEDLNSDDEEKDNLGIEEGYVPDGIADHHQIINETTLNDRSQSEFWSSFSSSEEALLNCAGLILSLPLNPHRSCEKHRSDDDFDAASLANRITYSVPTNGYYFFVFSSENEVQDNYIRVSFNLQKTVYDVSNPVRQCSNATEQCDLPLSFFSNQKVVFELPVKANETRWNEEFLVVSECEPRTAVYLVCVLSVPLLILFFAFQ